MSRNWKEKIKQGDITEACRRAGVSTTIYHNSGKISPDKWTSGMSRVNMELKKIIDEREKFISDYLDEELELCN
jgi:hypothetical protein